MTSFLYSSVSLCKNSAGFLPVGPSLQQPPVSPLKADGYGGELSRAHGRRHNIFNPQTRAQAQLWSRALWTAQTSHHQPLDTKPIKSPEGLSSNPWSIFPEQTPMATAWKQPRSQAVPGEWVLQNTFQRLKDFPHYHQQQGLPQERRTNPNQIKITTNRKTRRGNVSIFSPT